MSSIKLKKKLRIAYLSDSEVPSYRANTVHVVKMCSALSSEGAEVTLFCNRNENFVEEDVFDSFKVKTRFRILAITTRFGGKFRLLEYAIKKARAVNRNKFDVCYGRSLLALLFIPKKMPFVYESHILPNRKLSVYFERKLLQRQNCRKLVVISQSLKNEYLKLFPFLSKEKIEVLHDGADTDNEPIREEDAPKGLVEAHQRGVTIGYIGHLYPGKCMEVMMQIAQRMPEQTFHVIGGTKEWIDYWKNLSEENHIENIVFYGYVENSKVSSCYKFIDIVLLPFSDSIYYNKDKKDDIGKYISPLKLFEAMACGKAIVASKLVSIEEVIEDGKDGLLIEPSNYDFWKVVLNKLIIDVNTRNSLGEKAKLKLEKKYSWLRRAKKIINIFEK